MVFNICVKFHENMSSGFKVMERTQKLLTHKGHGNMYSGFSYEAESKIFNRHRHRHRERESERERKDENIIPHGILRMPGV